MEKTSRSAKPKSGRFFYGWWIVLLGSLILGFFVFAFKYHFVSRIFIFLFAVLDLILVVGFRCAARNAVHSLSGTGESLRMILLVGMGERVSKVARAIEKNQDLGLKIRGFLSTDDQDSPQQVNQYPVLGRAHDLPRLLENEVIDEVIFALSQEELKNMGDLLLLCEERGITARVTIDFFPHIISKTHLEEIEGLPLLTFSTTPKNELLLFLRRTFDVIGSIFLILLLSPLLLLIILLIRLKSPGRTIYRQVRVGLNGRKFTLYKFRSMVQGAEAKREELGAFNLMTGPVFKMKNDPRVTRVGRFLRKTSLDELPQLFKVLRAGMSFLWPIPPIPEEVKKLAGQSADATDKITSMIKEIQSKTNLIVVSMDENVGEVEESVVIIENVGQALEKILLAAKETSSEVQDISEKVNLLVKDSNEATKMMENISGITEKAAISTEEISSVSQEQSASLQEITASSQTLAKIAENLQKLVSMFKV